MKATEVQLRRSVLYMPGNNQRAMEKAKGLGVDGIIVDLEDAVASHAKAQARDLVCQQVQQGGYGHREVVIRVNGEATSWHEEDIVNAAYAGPAAILVPKVEDAAMAQRCLQRIERAAGRLLPLWVMIETPAGVTNVDEIAAVSGVEVLVMGTSDLNKELRGVATPAREAMFYALSRTVMAARNYGCDALDGVSLDLSDLEAFEFSCRQGRMLGFDGKTLIHPNQIDISNRIFGPNSEEIKHARRVLEAWQEAESAGHGVAVLDGQMIENLHARQARRVVAFAEAISARN